MGMRISYIRVLRRRTLVDVAPGRVVPTPEVEGERTNVNQDTTVRSKILSHFIKRKISFSRMETIFMIFGELEYLESSVRLARRKKDLEAIEN
jgi:hypothetical protein